MSNHPTKHGARVFVTDEQLGYGPDDWRHLAAGSEWYNPASQAVIADEDMPDELKTQEVGDLFEAYLDKYKAALRKQLEQEGLL